jgi:hypothetical protein
MKLLLPVCFLLSFSAMAQSQSTTGTATTKGACSPANTGNKNTFIITCGIGRVQGDQMLKILNKILADQIDPNAVMAKLNEIEQGISDIRESVQQQARIIRTLELEVQLVVNTEPTAVDQYPQSPFGLTNVAALFTSDGRTFYLVNDSRTYEYQQFSPTQRKFRFVFHPYTMGDVLGHQIDTLREFVRFDSGYSGFIRDSKANLVLAPADMQLTVKINGLQVKVLNRRIPYDSLLRQEFEISVRDEFSRIPDDYSKASAAQ